MFRLTIEQKRKKTSHLSSECTISKDIALVLNNMLHHANSKATDQL